MSEPWKCRRCGDCCRITLVPTTVNPDVTVEGVAMWDDYLSGFGLRIGLNPNTREWVIVRTTPCEHFHEHGPDGSWCDRHDNLPEVCKVYKCDDGPHLRLNEVMCRRRKL